MGKSFLSCDWGTSSFRLRLIDIDSGTTVSESVSDEGIAWANEAFALSKDKSLQRANFYYTIIDRHIKKISCTVKNMEEGLPVMISGMASSNIGILELPYTMLPFSTGGEDIGVKRMGKENSFAHELNIISGARTATDVMRGEETQLIGCANGHSHDRQLFIFPGTHSKHITTVNGKATGLKTYMTGELFSLLSGYSILAGSISAPAETGDEENNTAFAEGVRNGCTDNLSHALFIVRTNHLLKRFSKEANYHYLSGVLIGSELGGLPNMEPGTITIAGEARLMNSYLKACRVLGIGTAISTIDAASATIQGQLAIYRRLYV